MGTTSVWVVVLGLMVATTQSERPRVASPADVAPRPAERTPLPRGADGKPDLSGVWSGGGPAGTIEAGLAPGDIVPLLPEAKRLKESRQAKDETSANCLPLGVPRIPFGVPWRLVQTQTHVFILFEGNVHSFRQIFIDGRGHPEGDALNPSWYGHSIGRWDGDTLVVDSLGFNGRFWLDYIGHPATEKLHVIERFTRRTYQSLVREITIDDPGAYSRTFNLMFTASLQPGEEL